MASDLRPWLHINISEKFGWKYINPLKTKRRPLYLKTQSVPRC